ncbi:hypothetical protein EDB84DRAFT_1446867 [Lactarius hengduanensis]|nr:hypothetical protein EDB84DRAFT_1446867 [Lactarius hengduanensis]
MSCYYCGLPRKALPPREQTHRHARQQMSEVFASASGKGGKDKMGNSASGSRVTRLAGRGEQSLTSHEQVTTESQSQYESRIEMPALSCHNIIPVTNLQNPTTKTAEHLQYGLERLLDMVETPSSPKGQPAAVGLVPLAGTHYGRT